MAPGSLAWKIIGARGSLGGKDAPASKEGMAHSSPRANAATPSPPPVHLLSNEDSQNSVLSSRFASRQGTMKDVQRLMEERETASLEGSLGACRAH